MYSFGEKYSQIANCSGCEGQLCRWHFWINGKISGILWVLIALKVQAHFACLLFQSVVYLWNHCWLTASLVLMGLCPLQSYFLSFPNTMHQAQQRLNTIQEMHCSSVVATNKKLTTRWCPCATQSPQKFTISLNLYVLHEKVWFLGRREVGDLRCLNLE